MRKELFASFVPASFVSASIVLTAFVLAAVALPAVAQEKTAFQTAGQWKPATDVRSDVSIVYGVDDRPGMTFEQRVQSWRDKGYKTHFMTGIAWGEYKDYFTGQWDGRWHLDEGQVAMRGDTIWHGHLIPYIVPSLNYLKYIKETKIKRVIDAGIDAIYLEEPEFWARAGYSESFKKEWFSYYGFPWRPQHTSAENTYLSNKLKYHLYYRALNEAFSYAKSYGKSKGMNVRCYVPTHSLVNYSQWMIVSPEASLASLPCVDGYIAQVWTGTSREPNFFNGKVRERVFETAYLEYGCMTSMTEPTHRTVYLLTDPVEDNPDKDWSDYKHNYEATFTAELMYPNVNNFEVMPWPDRIYEGTYPKEAFSKERIRIPRFYSTQMQVMVNALNKMPVCDNKVSGSHGVSVLMGNSMMFQRSPTPVEGYDDPQLSNFYGEALPLVKRGVPVSITHIENASYADTWKDVKVLLMSYANMKPLDSIAHRDIARWVRDGGVLVYSGRDSDPYQSVREWWNLGGNHFTAPSQHLFRAMGMPEQAEQGRYTYGKGAVYVLRHDPAEYVLTEGRDSVFVETVTAAYEKDARAGKLKFKNSLVLERGPYTLVSVLDENNYDGGKPLTIKGKFIDLFDHRLPVMDEKTVLPGSQAMLLDINRVKDKSRPQVLAAASREYDEEVTAHSYSFVVKSPANTTNCMRVLLPSKARTVSVTDSKGQKVEFTASYDKHTKTELMQFENHPEGMKVTMTF